MKKLSKLLVLALAATMIGCVAGCNNNSGSNSSKTESSAASSAAEKSEDADATEDSEEAGDNTDGDEGNDSEESAAEESAAEESTATESTAAWASISAESIATAYAGEGTTNTTSQVIFAVTSDSKGFLAFGQQESDGYTAVVYGTIAAGEKQQAEDGSLVEPFTIVDEATSTNVTFSIITNTDGATRALTLDGSEVYKLAEVDGASTAGLIAKMAAAGPITADGAGAPEGGAQDGDTQDAGTDATSNADDSTSEDAGEEGAGEEGAE